MAYALVGTIGVASQGAVTTAVTPAWGTSENRTAGNLLICFCSVTGTATAPTTPSGWSGGAGSLLIQGTSCSASIFWKIAAGADAAPTIAAITSGVIAAQLAEYSGNSGTQFDQVGTASGISSPITATLSGADAATTDLILVCGADFRSTARSPNDTWTSNHATITAAGNNNGISSANHYSFGYSLSTTSNSGADTVTMTLSVTTSITGLAVIAATFLVAPLPILPDLIQQPLVPRP